MLGATAIAERKLQHANPLPILGFDVGVGRAGVIFQPEGDKKEQWMLQIRTALVRMRLDGGEASSLAGRLSFGAQHLFRRCACACMCVRRHVLQSCVFAGWAERCSCRSLSRSAKQPAKLTKNWRRLCVGGSRSCEKTSVRSGSCLLSSCKPDYHCIHAYVDMQAMGGIRAEALAVALRREEHASKGRGGTCDRWPHRVR